MGANLVSDTITQEYVKDCGIVIDSETGEEIGQEKIRVMSPFEIKERVELNTSNTSSALRARVLEELSKSNGHDKKREIVK